TVCRPTADHGCAAKVRDRTRSHEHAAGDNDGGRRATAQTHFGHTTGCARLDGTPEQGIRQLKCVATIQFGAVMSIQRQSAAALCSTDSMNCIPRTPSVIDGRASTWRLV